MSGDAGAFYPSSLFGWQQIKVEQVARIEEKAECFSLIANALTNHVQGTQSRARNTSFLFLLLLLSFLEVTFYHSKSLSVCL